MQGPAELSTVKLKQRNIFALCLSRVNAATVYQEKDCKYLETYWCTMISSVLGCLVVWLVLFVCFGGRRVVFGFGFCLLFF